MTEIERIKAHDENTKMFIAGLPLNQEDVEGGLDEVGIQDSIARALLAVGEDELASFTSLDELRQKLTRRGITTSVGLF